MASKCLDLVELLLLCFPLHRCAVSSTSLSPARVSVHTSTVRYQIRLMILPTRSTTSGKSGTFGKDCKDREEEEMQRESQRRSERVVRGSSCLALGSLTSQTPCHSRLVHSFPTFKYTWNIEASRESGQAAARAAVKTATSKVKVKVNSSPVSRRQVPSSGLVGNAALIQVRFGPLPVYRQRVVAHRPSSRKNPLGSRDP